MTSDSQAGHYPRIGPGTEERLAAAELARAVAAEHEQTPLTGHGEWCDLAEEAEKQLRLGLAAAAMGHIVEMVVPGPWMGQRQWRCVNCWTHVELSTRPCPPAVPAGLVPVTVFHHAAGTGVYQPGDPVIRAFSYTARVGPGASRPLMREHVTVDRVAEHALILSVASPDRLNGDEQQFAPYHERQLRGIKYGDLVQVGDVILANQVVGRWRVQAGPVNEITRTFRSSGG